MKYLSDNWRPTAYFFLLMVPSNQSFRQVGVPVHSMVTPLLLPFYPSPISSVKMDHQVYFAPAVERTSCYDHASRPPVAGPRSRFAAPDCSAGLSARAAAALVSLGRDVSLGFLPGVLGIDFIQCAHPDFGIHA